jgi:hypothetical protein
MANIAADEFDLVQNDLPRLNGHVFDCSHRDFLRQRPSRDMLWEQTKSQKVTKGRSTADIPAHELKTRQ